VKRFELLIWVVGLLSDEGGLQADAECPNIPVAAETIAVFEGAFSVTRDN
jgi:hypothetical protein